MKHNKDKSVAHVYEGWSTGRGKGNVLGSGMSGEVKIVTHRETGVKYACKSVNKRDVRDQDMMEQEIALLRELDHPNIVRMRESYEDDRNIYLVMELCAGGELFDRLEARDQYVR